MRLCEDWIVKRKRLQVASIIMTVLDFITLLSAEVLDLVYMNQNTKSLITMRNVGITKVPIFTKIVVYLLLSIAIVVLLTFPKYKPVIFITMM